MIAGLGRQRFLAAGMFLAAFACGNQPATGGNTNPPDPVPLALTVTPVVHHAMVQLNTPAQGDSVAVALSGDGAATTSWTASHRQSWTTLLTSTGTGAGMVRWSRDVSGLTLGLHVDTISITASGASGSPFRIYDSVMITAAPVPLSLQLTPATPASTVVVGSTTILPAEAAIAITGTGAESEPWSATKRRGSTTLTTANGTGSGAVRWTRNPTGLAVGTYVDTITVAAAGANGSPAIVVDTLRVAAAAGGPQPDLGVGASLHGKRLFPANDPWNRPVDTAQVDPNSTAILSVIGLTKSLHPDFGADWCCGPFGFPYVVVAEPVNRYTPSFYYPNESDPGPYPIPPNPPIEGGGQGDAHLLVIHRDEWKLYELYDLHPAGNGWTAGSGAIFDLTNGTQRPAGWTSADAAGLPIFPGLVRYDEVYEQGEILHALRMTIVHTRQAYIPPATHWASPSNDPLLPPMGMRVRLKASYDISGFPEKAQVILRALKKYGMIVADNGGDFFLSGTADARWIDSVNETLKLVKVGDFEVIKMQGVVTP